MKTMIKTTLMIVAASLAFAALAPAQKAEAKSCGDSAAQSCLPAKDGMVGQVGEASGEGLSTRELGKIRWAATQYVGEISDIARQISRALPVGGEAADLIAAIKRKDGVAVQRMVQRNTRLGASFERLERMGFNTITVGLEAGGAVETGFSMDLGYAWTPRLYTTTSLAGDTPHGGAGLVFSFYKPNNTRIDGHAYGTTAQVDLGSGAGLNMWFTDTPFDFTGFSVGVGIGSAAGAGAVTYAMTKLWK